jgi:hypothetical protein
MGQVPKHPHSVRTLCVPPTTILCPFDWNKIHSAVVEGTQIISRFFNKMNHKISHLKGLQRTAPDGSGAQASA